MILVTGGTGLVGSHLLYHLALKNNAIRAIYRSEKKRQAVKHVFSYYSEEFEALFSKIEWVEATLNDLPKLNDAFKAITQVYHCAALVSFDPNDYYKLRKVNIEGTSNIVNLSLKHKVQKMCYVSSIAAIADAPINTLATEDDPWNPDADHNVYAITKYGAELEVWRGSQEGLDVVVVNPGIIVGPGFWRSSSGSFFKRIYKGLNYYTLGSTAYIDIQDVIQPMLQLMNSTIKNERYILISEHLSFKTFAESVARQLNVAIPKKEASQLLLKIAWRLDWLSYFFKRKRRKLTKHMVRSITTDSLYSNEKIRTELNYSFKSINQSIKETSRFFLEDLAV